MRNAYLLAVVGLTAVTAVMGRAAAVQFEPRPQQQPQYAGDGYSNYRAGGPGATAAAAIGEDEDYGPQASARFHHGKHKLQKKLKKRLLLQCLLEQRRRRRRDTSDAASGRFLLPVVLQSTNVNVGSGGGGGGYGGYSDSQNHQYGGGGCMQLGGNNPHGPLGSLSGPLESLSGPLGSLGGTLGSLGGVLGSTMEEGDGARGLSADWNRYARRFHRNFVRPLYRLF